MIIDNRSGGGFAHTSLSGNANVVCVDFGREVGQGGAVGCGEGVVLALCELGDSGIPIGVVGDDVLADEINVVETVDQICSPVHSGLAVGDSEATAAK